MQDHAFQTEAHAKCILAGEHAVIRECPAIVIPIPHKVITLFYEPSVHPIKVTCDLPYEEVFLTIFWNTFKEALKGAHKQLPEITGKLSIENNIPMGVGIGFSSALCVSITRWLIEKNFLDKNKLFDYAHHLENLFHKRSSGVDIAGAMANGIIHYERKAHIIKKVPIHWHPNLYISYSGSSKYTAEAITQVTSFRKTHHHLGELIDDEMLMSVEMIEKALKMDEKKGLQILAEGIEHANHCFEEWHLISSELKQHMSDLRKLGALAVKPTGAGIGGYVLSLWQDKPNEENSIEFISLFEQQHIH